jgi:UPF0755 protein
VATTTGKTARRARRGPKSARAVVRVITWALLLVAVSGVAAVAWLLLVYPNRAGTGAGRAIEITPSEPGGVDALTEALAREGIVESPFLLATYLRLIGADERLRTVTVRLDDSMTPGALSRALAVGLGRVEVRVTIPEGFDRFDVAGRLAELGVCDGEEFLAMTTDRALLDELDIEGESVEGYLFPDTYELRTETPPKGVIRRMVQTFRQRILPLVDEHADGLAALRRDLGWGLREAVILASVVEKEAAVPAERPTIAGVFLNRLRSETFRPKRLQADPTVMYGCRAHPDASAPCRAFDGRDITRDMLRDPDNPYNTYRIEGLPPGPISNPGLETIRAVLAPEEHGYFFFVARGGRRHHFSATLGEHEEAVDRNVEREAGGGG